MKHRCLPNETEASPHPPSALLSLHSPCCSVGAGDCEPQKMEEEAVSDSACCYCKTEHGGGDPGEEDALPWLCSWYPAPVSRVHHPGTPSGQPGQRWMKSPTALYRNRNTPTDGQTDRRGFSPSRGGGALCHAPAAAPCSPQIPSSSSPSLSAKSSPCFLAPDPGDQTRGDITAQNREQNRERIQKQHDCSVAQQASSGPGPRTGRRDGKN